LAETRWPPSFKTRNDLFCVIASDQVEDQIDLLSQDLLELRLSIIDNTAGADGFEIRLIVAACGGN